MHCLFARPLQSINYFRNPPLTELRPWFNLKTLPILHRQHLCPYVLSASLTPSRSKMPRRRNKPKPSTLVTSQYGDLHVPSPEEIGSCSSKAALPRLQFEDGDLLIKLSKHHWLLVHSAVVANVSPVLGTSFTDAWTDSGNNLETIVHPVTGKNINVRTLALKRVDGTYLLEGKVCTR